MNFNPATAAKVIERRKLLPDMVVRIGSLAGLALLAALSIARMVRAPAVVPATAPDTVFSAQRALVHVEQIAARPHAIGMADHDRVRDYITAQLQALGAHPQIQRTTGISTRYRSAGRVQNILGWLPGGSASRDAVLLVAHYDGVEAGPAAGDDGAGAAAILETLRAIRAQKRPLQHDVIALISDGEEAGLLGAAGFVREHPWAKDVAVVLDFEARGTTGRSLMFETGRGDLDAVRALRNAGDVTAGSVFTTVYRTLANDTDLSELARLERPGLNFAFVGGVERYHTSHDDVSHLNPGSLQHHGSQMLSLARTFANETLPRPRTGDAVFFDLPLVGLVVYPVGLALPIAVIGALLVVVVLVRDRAGWGALVGLGAAVSTVVLSGAAAMAGAGVLRWLHSYVPSAGDALPQWRGLTGLAVACVAVGTTLICQSVARRWASDRGLYSGTILVLLALSLLTSLTAPGASYLFTWPLITAAIAALAPNGPWRSAANWVVAAVVLLLLAGFAHGVAVLMLGVAGAGAAALGILSSLILLSAMPVLLPAAGTRRFLGADLVFAAALALIVVAAVAERPSAEHPVRTALVYAQNDGDRQAWFGTPSGFSDSWSRAATANRQEAPAWTRRVVGNGMPVIGIPVPSAMFGAPTLAVVHDTVIAGGRRTVLRLTAPRGATEVMMRLRGARVFASWIDGRAVDTTRYRQRSSQWSMSYYAVPDSGALIGLALPLGARVEMDLVSRTPGLPALPGIRVPTRPESVVPVQTGDASYVYRTVRF